MATKLAISYEQLQNENLNLRKKIEKLESETTEELICKVICILWFRLSHVICRQGLLWTRFSIFAFWGLRLRFLEWARRALQDILFSKNIKLTKVISISPCITSKFKICYQAKKAEEFTVINCGVGLKKIFYLFWSFFWKPYKTYFMQNLSTNALFGRRPRPYLSFLSPKSSAKNWPKTLTA